MNTRTGQISGRERRQKARESAQCDDDTKAWSFLESSKHSIAPELPLLWASVCKKNRSFIHTWKLVQFSAASILLTWCQLQYNTAVQFSCSIIHECILTMLVKNFEEISRKKCGNKALCLFIHFAPPIGSEVIRCALLSLLEFFNSCFYFRFTSTHVWRPNPLLAHGHVVLRSEEVRSNTILLNI